VSSSVAAFGAGVGTGEGLGLVAVAADDGVEVLVGESVGVPGLGAGAGRTVKPKLPWTG
jgi:hypothetical protein